MSPDERDAATLTSISRKTDTESEMQLSFRKRPSRSTHHRAAGAARLADLRPGEQAVLDRLEVPDDVARRLMELGFLPGSVIVAAHAAPGGDPRVFRVDGSEIALRRETAVHLLQ
jgi:ferrous iron transport protein A